MTTERSNDNSKVLGDPRMPRSRARIMSMTFIAMFVVLIAVCSWISIPMTIPFTLQTFAVFVAAGLLGPVCGFAAVLIYLLIGLVGLPVFANFTSGFGILLGPTGGYMIGFLFTALAVGLMMKKLGRSLPVMIIAMLLGLLICYAFGTAWFMIMYANAGSAVSLAAALGWCVLPFIIPDCAKIALAILLIKRLEKHIPKEIMK